MVPTEKAVEIGVRNIIDKNDVSKVLNILEEDETEMSDNWNKRYRDNIYYIITVSYFIYKFITISCHFGFLSKK